ncbi:sulfite exporter TauE/SafE family protein [Streptomyces sp. HNM0575]|uniref:sulfite exporter TauE/SafE family protein n=1 Tax=Streptomyces sp. HNM0575 TaxID=2716338 RepID=UPI00145F9DD7|nr:sulfite exporter TauE/SafE family protein [Streptomyces sp. HNM0575]NLU71435.1 sulfite exporter TauE/SafE family protein [Streptomyces sp. HNM0575]
MLTGWPYLALLGGTVLLGSSVQRLAGIGFGMLAAPGLVLLMGPVQGVALVNCAGVVIGVAGLATSWPYVRLRTMVPLVAAAALTVPLGAWLALRLPEPVLLTGLGVLITAAVLLVICGARVRALHGRAGAVAAGAASGFMNSAAGSGGPALSLYAVNAGWTAGEFVPNAQFYGLVVNLMSAAAKGLPQLTRPAWLLVAATMGTGIVLGHLLAARTPEKGARRIILGLALAGGVATGAKGLWLLA